MIRSHVILSVFRRNILSYFSGVLGYLFVVVFVVAGSFAAFSPQFFANNLANLDQLSRWYPMLLLFIVPAITMSTWADEKKLGTDELLFTLPASDVEILLGKYFAVLAVYSVTLLFSITHALVLQWIGSPDVGLLFATYFGYWIAGAALLSAGMFASVLTNSTTVAFVLGTVICAIPVFIDQITPFSESLQNLSISSQIRDFTAGMLPISGLFYFASLTVFMLYLNMIFITKRHWSGGQKGNMGVQFAVRSVALAVALVSLNIAAAHVSRPIDMTAEKLYTLSDTTAETLAKIDENQPILIQAYISSEVPPEYVPVRKKLTGLLRQYDQMGGDGVEVRFVDVEPFSKQAEEARQFGIEARDVQTERGGRTSLESIFLGVVMTSPYDEVVVPFFDTGLPVEYELTRSIRTVSKEERLTVGILSTDSQVTGGFDMSSFRSLPKWKIAAELEKQYKVESVSPDSEIDAKKYDCLIAVMPSSLTQPQMENFVNYVALGKPVLIFDDPLPVSGPQGVMGAPRLPKPRAGGGMMGMQQQPEPKADNGQATSLLNLLEIAWDNGQVVWDNSGQSLHPEFGEALRPELVFISPQAGVDSAFSPNSSITSGLQELVVFFSGTIRPRANSKLKFEPLLRTSQHSGLIDWNDITSPGMFGGVTLNPNPPYFVDSDAHVISAHITSDEKDHSLNVIFVADSDLISDQMFFMRERGFRRDEDSAELKLDNVTFVLNAVDVLAGDDSYLKLRKRREKLRTLEKVEQQTAKFLAERKREEEKADEDADQKLDEAKERFAKERERIEKDESLDDRSRAIQLRIEQETESRRVEVAEANIERRKQDRIAEIKAGTERKVREIENKVRFWAILLPPIPAILLGIILMVNNINNERRNISPERRVKK